MRVPVAAGPLDAEMAVAGAFHGAHEQLYGYGFAGRADQRVEWVNLRVSGVGPIRRPDLVAHEAGDGDPSRALTGRRRVVFEEPLDDAPVYWRPSLAPGDVIEGPAIIEEFGSTIPLHPGFTARVDPHLNLLITTCVRSSSSFSGDEHDERTQDVADADQVLVEIVQGTLGSVEREVETAIGRTSRSPMIRDAHDYRVGIHDAKLRKLTGRSYSALVHPVARDYPLETMQPGDVFFHNDVYASEGGIGHLPDLCVTVPVFASGRVVAFVQAFGHHDDIGGAVPGSMPSTATSVFEEGLMVPPIKLWSAGRARTRPP